MSENISQQDRVDLLRERREVREMIIQEQKDIQNLVSLLKTGLSLDMVDPEYVNHTNTYSDVFENMSEVYDEWEDKQESLENNYQRLETVNGQLE